MTMTALDTIKSKLIDRIMVTKNEKLLKAIEAIFSSTQLEEIHSLDSHQIEMLQMSENDIREGNLISENDLEKSDSEWMN